MLHEICFRIIYNDKQLSFNELFNKDSSISTRIRLSPLIMDNVFKLKIESEFSRPIAKTLHHGTESISYLGPKIWDTLPEKLWNMEIISFIIVHTSCVGFIEGAGFP